MVDYAAKLASIARDRDDVERINNVYIDIDNKFALISLICLLTDAQRKKSPGVTCYSIIKKVLSIIKLEIPDDYCEGLAIICEDFMIGTNKYNSCGLKSSKEIIEKIGQILANWLPF